MRYKIAMFEERIGGAVPDLLQGLSDEFENNMAELLCNIDNDPEMEFHGAMFNLDWMLERSENDEV